MGLMPISPTHQSRCFVYLVLASQADVSLPKTYPLAAGRIMACEEIEAIIQASKCGRREEALQDNRLGRQIDSSVEPRASRQGPPAGGGHTDSTRAEYRSSIPSQAQN